MSNHAEDRIRELEAELEHLRARTDVLVDGSPLGIFFDDADDKCVFVNTTFCEIMELSQEEALGDGWARTVHPDDLLRLLDERSRAVRDGVALFRAEYRYRCKSGRSGWVEEQTRPVCDPFGRVLGYVGTLAEISERKEREALQSRYSEELAARVRERTAELQEQTERLAEMNAALKVLLAQRDRDREDLEQAVLANVRRRIHPVLDRLAVACPSAAAHEITAELRRAIGELTSSFCHRLSSACQQLTPAEMQVADLIRQGLATKEIATRLGVGSSTIDSHRLHIRRKLGLVSRQTNLRSYLTSLDPD